MSSQLLNFLETNKNTRKIFGKRELKIIEKQLMAVPLTQSEKNRLSRDIRKKLEFIKEIAKFEDEFKLKKGSVINEKIKNIIELIKDTIWFPKIKKLSYSDQQLKIKDSSEATLT